MYIRSNFVTLTFLVTFLLLAVLIILIIFDFLEFDNKVGIGIFTGLPLFLITIFQLLRTQRIQRASYIKEFLTEFRRYPELYEAYYDLVYSYNDKIFEDVEKIANNIGKIEEKEMPKYDCFQDLQNNRREGSRIYYPQYFRNSIEERRLDGLLDYFNTVAFYWYENLIKMEDIVNLLGDYLAVIADRDIIQNYLDYVTDEWQYDRIGTSPPYQYLILFIEAFKKYGFKRFVARRRNKLKEEVKKAREIRGL